VSIALASFRDDDIVTPFFLLAGLAASLGTLFATIQLWSDSRLTYKNLMPWSRPEELDGRYEALVFITWGMILLGATYLAMLFMTFYAERGG
jgi:hypothetical protein